MTKPVLSSGVTQVSTGPASGSNDTGFEDGVEVGGCVTTGWERLHGGEDQGQTLGNVFVRGTGQSWCVTCRVEKGKEKPAGL